MSDKIVPLRRPPKALRPGGLKLVSHHTLPAAVATAPFTVDQARYILEAPALDRASGDDLTENAADMTRMAHLFQLDRMHATTSRERASQLRDARNKAEDLARDLRRLTGDVHADLIAALEAFQAEARDEQAASNWIVSNLARASRRERPDAMSVRYFMVLLGHRFAEIFRVEPTASPQGPFQRFADAFLEAMQENLPAQADVKLPTGATVLKHLAKYRREFPAHSFKPSWLNE